MKPINTNDLRRIDLNLALVFFVIYSEQSVTGAAGKLFLTQPAISASLAKLRELCGDALFVRSGRNLRATPFAERMFAVLKPALAQMQAGFTEREQFNPKISTQVFRIGLLDDIEIGLIPPLSRYLRVQAPGIRLSVHASDFRSLPGQLEREEIDVAVGVFESLPGDVQREEVLKSTFRTLYDPKMLKLGRSLSLARYIELEHVLVSFSGDFRGVFEEKFSESQYRRNIVMTTPHFSALPYIIKDTTMVTTIPEYLAQHFARTFDLATIATPFAAESFALEMIWPSYLDSEPDHQWLRARLRQLLRIKNLVSG